MDINKLILAKLKEDKTKFDIEIATSLKSEYPICKSISKETLRRRVCIIRHENNLRVKRYADWNKVYSDFDKISKKYPDRPMSVIVSTLSNKYNLCTKYLSPRLYMYRRYGV